MNLITDFFPYFIDQFSRILNFVFNIVINQTPRITLGQFALTCAFIGFVIYFLFGSDFIPTLSDFKSNYSKENKITSNSIYVPRHAPGNSKKDFSTRVSRHKQ